MAYQVSQPDIVNLGPPLVRLWTNNLHMGTAPAEKYDWYYRNNPLGRGIAFMLESKTDAATEFVGSCGLGPRTVYVDDKPLRAGLLADFTVDKAHRTVLPALMLQRAVAEYARDHFDITYAYPNASAVGIFSRIGYEQLGRSGRYVRPLRIGPFVGKVVRVESMRRPVAAVGDVALRVRDSIRALRAGGLRVQWTTSIDQRFDRLFERVRSKYSVIGDRTARFLHWRFMERLGIHAQCATLTDSTNELRAYAIVTEKEPGTALLADFLGLTEGDLGLLFDRIATRLRSQGYTSIRTYFLGAPVISAALTKHGFRFRNPGKFIVFLAPQLSAARNGGLKEPNSWYLTEADRDN